MMKRIKLIWLLAFTAVACLIMIVEWNVFNEGTTGGIIQLELAQTHTNAKEIVVANGWNIPAVKWNTILDFLFVITYTALLFSMVWRISKVIGGAFVFIGMIAGSLAIVTGLFDCIENVRMLAFLNHPDDVDNFRPAYFFAKWKFIFCVVCLVYFMIAGIIIIDRKKPV